MNFMKILGLNDSIFNWHCKHCGHSQYGESRIMEFSRDCQDNSGICDTCWDLIVKNMKMGKKLAWVRKKIILPNLTDPNESKPFLVSYYFGLDFIDGGIVYENATYTDYLRLKYRAYMEKMVEVSEIPVSHESFVKG